MDKNIQRKIVAACDFSPSDIVFEIGAGRGDLTYAIAPQVNRLYCLEIDPNLCALLEDKFKPFANTRIICRDILKFDFSKYLPRTKNKVKVIGNIPYYISSPIIAHLLKFKDDIDDIFITVQKEFAQRMTAPCGSKEFGSLSCFVQYYFTAQTIFPIKRNSFLPAPKVDSSLVRLAKGRNRHLTNKQEAALFVIIRASFGQRRKTLRNSLEGIVPFCKLELFFKRHNLDKNIRPEMLSLEDFITLSLS